MAKKMKKFMAMMLVLCMMASMMSVSAFAADGTVVENTTTEEFGVPTDVTTTTTTVTDENGNVTVTVTVEKSADDVDADGVAIKAEETRVETTVSDANGKQIASNFVVDGSETKEWTEEDNGDGAQPEVEVTLIPGETTTGSATTTETVTNADGSVTTTTTTERVVVATATENETKVEVAGTSDMSALKQDTSIVDGNMDEEQLLEAWTYQDAFSDGTSTKAPEGYDYLFSTLGQMSQFYAGTESVNANGETVLGTTGALQFILEYNPDFDPADHPKGYDDIPVSKDQITAGEDLYFAYCCDMLTGGKDNFWYRIDSLEDAGYYDEESASYIRAIAMNGYWGTAEGTGSLNKLKDDMKAALAAGDISGITEEEIDAITQGQALNATQGAIWKYANSTTEGNKIDPDRLVVKGNKGDVPTEQDAKQARAVYDFLMSLAPIAADAENEVIDQDAFIKEDSMSITVGDKISGNAANADDNKDNDVYEASLNFALVVTPTNGDDLVVQIITGFDAEGKAIIAAQGRIAGGNAEEDAANGFHEVVYDAATGTYTLKNLALAENSDFNFDLKLVGTQHLEQGVYIFTSENRNGTTSQTFVSVLEGEKEVNVSKGYTISFNVDEDNQIVAQRVWHDDSDPEEAPVPFNFGHVVPRPLDNIPDEEVPLADAPQTGDEAAFFAILTVLAGISLMAMHVSEQKRKEEA